MSSQKQHKSIVAGEARPDGGISPSFCWLASDIIPSHLDLRRRGWDISSCAEPSRDCIGIFHKPGLDSPDWMNVLSSVPFEARRHIMVTGVERAGERAELLQIGFGDALPREVDLSELEARARRIAESSSWLPRLRQVGPLKLDLLAREAFGFDRPLNLNPREFALLWRLAESLGQSVSKQSLVQDVWRMGFVPETNSIAVHMSRLRRKLAFVGLAGVIETSAPGYRLRSPCENGNQSAARKTTPQPSKQLDRQLTADLSEA